MKIKRNTTDKYFSDAVRMAADYTCQCCSKQSQPPFDNGMIDAAHCHSRHKRATRWHPGNIVCLCRACHMRQTNDPFEHTSFMRSYHGEGVQLMRELSQSLLKITKKDEKLILAHYKAEIKRIKQLRMDGVCGKIELEIPEILL